VEGVFPVLVKPIVKYASALFIKRGFPAIIFKVKGHPDKKVRGTNAVRTSPVVKVGRFGKFETINTIYEKKR
jgi:hypothetical protein